ncbi:MAG: hypothetical protein KDC44_00780 [Phaeodactylibacter sp.]|nr:hypothetical protein [Phaeodactylibacter sp.]
MLKKVLKWTGIVVGVLILGLVIAGFIMNEPLPKGKKGPEAEALAQKMLNAINIEAWNQTGMISWDFMGRHSFLWDKKRNFVEVTWGENRVLLNSQTVKGLAYQHGVLVSDSQETEDLVQKAWAFFCNDSFWLNAPAKAMDPGTERELVTLEDGSAALKVSYTSGGVTPGDTYLWLLQDDGLPYAWKMWTQILPVQGAKSTWDDWVTLPSGARLATKHKTMGLEMEMKGIKSAEDWQDFGLDSDPFQPLLNN